MHATPPLPRQSAVPGAASIWLFLPQTGLTANRQPLCCQSASNRTSSTISSNPQSQPTITSGLNARPDPTSRFSKYSDPAVNTTACKW
eukprot:364952-Chlamydomonas_euryale.AAC.11